MCEIDYAMLQIVKDNIEKIFSNYASIKRLYPSWNIKRGELHLVISKVVDQSIIEGSLCCVDHTYFIGKLPMDEETLNDNLKIAMGDYVAEVLHREQTLCKDINK